MKRVKSIFLVIIVVLVVAFASVLGYLKSVVPDEVGMVAVRTLSDTVEVRYDHYGVPHIAAQNDTDAFFALGYAACYLGAMRFAACGTSSKVNRVALPALLVMENA
mgnify:CR=1 FL=1